MRLFLPIAMVLVGAITLQCKSKRGGSSPSSHMTPSDQAAQAAGGMNTNTDAVDQLMSASQTVASSPDCAHPADYSAAQSVCNIADQLATNTELATSVVTQAKETSTDGTKNIEVMKNVVATTTASSSSSWTGTQQWGLGILLLGGAATLGVTVGAFVNNWTAMNKYFRSLEKSTAKLAAKGQIEVTNSKGQKTKKLTLNEKLTASEELKMFSILGKYYEIGGQGGAIALDKDYKDENSELRKFVDSLKVNESEKATAILAELEVVQLELMGYRESQKMASAGKGHSAIAASTSESGKIAIETGDGVKVEFTEEDAHQLKEIHKDPQVDKEMRRANTNKKLAYTGVGGVLAALVGGGMMAWGGNSSSGMHLADTGIPQYIDTLGKIANGL